MRTKYMKVSEAKKYNLSQYPNFHRSGSIKGDEKYVLWKRCAAC